MRYNEEKYSNIKEAYLDNKNHIALKLIKEYVKEYPLDEKAKKFYLFLLKKNKMYEEASNFVINKGFDYEIIREKIDNKDYLKTLPLFRKFLDIHPYDYYVRLDYAKVLRYINKADEALNQILFIINNVDKSNKIIEYANMELFYIYLRLNNYEKAYYYLHITKDFRLEKKDNNKEQMVLEELFLKQRLNILTGEDYLTDDRYLKNQILSYSEDRAIRHILYHKKKSDNVEENVFEEELDLKELYYNVKQNLPNSISTELDNFAGKYYFEYPTIDDKELKRDYAYKYLMVVAFKDTLEIITMYPVFTNERIENINFLNQKIKTKRISQIDKFNRRYSQFVK